VKCNEILESKTLEKEISFCVYLPDGYSNSKEYPILYLFHGIWDEPKGLFDEGNLRSTTDSLIRNGVIQPLIIVAPNGLNDAFYINNYDRSINYEDFFQNEFMQHIEDKYPSSNRMIGGISMGGYGALFHGLKYKEKFTSIYALSPAVLEEQPVRGTDTRDAFYKALEDELWGPIDRDGYPKNYKKYSVHEMVSKMTPIPFPIPEDQKEKYYIPYITIDIGDEDFLLEQNLDLVKIMRTKNIDFEFRVYDGDHDWNYWTDGLARALIFTSNTSD
jgi:enterochelin esterase-like enzyme